MILEVLLSRLVHLAPANRNSASHPVRKPFDFTDFAEAVRTQLESAPSEGSAPFA